KMNDIPGDEVDAEDRVVHAMKDGMQRPVGGDKVLLELPAVQIGAVDHGPVVSVNAQAGEVLSERQPGNYCQSQAHYGQDQKPAVCGPVLLERVGVWQSILLSSAPNCSLLTHYNEYWLDSGRPL